MLRGRSQVALEFLLTYGWALLIVVVVIGAFSYFLLFDSDELLPNSCNLGVGLLSCDDVVVSENGVFLLLSGTQHTVVQVVGVEVSLKGEEVVSCEKNNVFLTTSLGNPVSFLVPCTMNLSEGRTDFDLSIDYVRAGTAFFKSINAQFSATVAAVQCVDVSECGGGEVCFAGFCVDELLVNSCSSSSQCDASAMCVAGVCKSLIGGVCTVGGDCVSGVCGADNTCKIPLSGDCSVNANACVDGAFCNRGNQCELLIVDGGMCTLATDCVSGVCGVDGTCRIPLSGDCSANANACVDGSFCNAGLCESLSAVGDMCSVTGDCVGDAFCNSGGQCESLRVIGGVCTVDGDCLSGACDTSAGVCGYQIATFAGNGIAGFWW